MAEYGLPGRPVILEGAAAGWKAMEWTIDDFRRRYRDVRIRPHGGDIVQANEETTIGEFMAAMASDTTGRFLSWPFCEQRAELMDSFRLPAFLADNWAPPQYRSSMFWVIVSPPHGGPRLHQDIYWSSAWNAQMVGRKRWRFCPPEDEALVYRGRVDTFAPDLDAFPLFARARCYEGTAGPGDIVFLPSRWWHQTCALDCGLALTGNYSDHTNYRYVIQYMENHGMTDLLAEFQQQVAIRTVTPEGSTPRPGAA